MTRLRHALLLALLLGAVRGYAIGLPDTGQDTCYNDSAADGVTAGDAASIAGDNGTHPRQDCRYGRDAAAAAGTLPKTGAGAKGFDYTKIANNGDRLDAGAALGTAPADWACTKDNRTGLTWELKTAPGAGFRSWELIYTWYSDDGHTNGGNPGTAETDDSCKTVQPQGLCNTQAYTIAVNATALCSYTDWRMPTRRELLTLIFADKFKPSIDANYFPNTPVSFSHLSPVWSGSTHSTDTAEAWEVNFANASVFPFPKAHYYYVRLVRGGPF